MFRNHAEDDRRVPVASQEPDRYGLVFLAVNAAIIAVALLLSRLA
jgi:hypothetical protein